MSSFSDDNFISIDSGLHTNASLYGNLDRLRTSSIIFGHGLGSIDPHITNHHTDSWVELVSNVVGPLNMTCIAYTARGHGASSGWQESVESNPTQFSWNQLSHDMISVANYYNCNKVVVSGNSMGAATALFATMNYPSRVSGSILLRPPTAWDLRRQRRDKLLEKADKLQLQHPSEPYHHVLRGACFADLPPAEGVDGKSVYESITCPLLILTIEGDPTHPVEVAVALARLIPTATLHIAPDIATAKSDWPALISSFLASLSLSEDQSC